MDLFILIALSIAWWLIGFVAMCWSYYWDWKYINDDKWLLGTISIAGPIVIPKAVMMYFKYQDLRK